MGRPQIFDINQIVWAKLTGYPWWPARVVTAFECPKSELESLKTLGNIPVRFYGGHDYAVIHESKAKDFDDAFEKFSGRNNTELFKRAIKEAQSDLHPEV
ncbi:MAG: PWWP domain-containing protein [Gammaproteobacteria bacterium]|nr:PWWP domain-containing protein [Gammaproteobacteria bacterium]